MKRIAGDSVRVLLVTALLLLGAVQFGSAATLQGGTEAPVMTPSIQSKIDALARKAGLGAEREAAAARRELQANVSGLFSSQLAPGSVTAAALAPPGPGGQPDYFGFTPNWAFSPPLRKFVDTLPGLGAGAANNLGNFVPIAKPDTITYPGSDYYEIELTQYEQQMHSDLPPTTLRGYVQVNNGTDGSGHNTLAPEAIHYLGPFIMSRKDRPVRIKFINDLPTGSGGDLFLPVDTTVMGAGTGPDGTTLYKENRATIHLHGGRTVWISDGTPHQWTTPAGESTPYPKGVSVKNVPDMPDPGDGSMTFFYSNQQSARLLWFHDHAYGITRLNVYTGMAAGYLLGDATEDRLVADGVIPSDQIPLVIQDKTFVDASTIATTDPTWSWGTTPPVARTGDLWFPHVYMPNQNPYDVTGANAMGRWDYGPWFFPPTTDIAFPPIPNPYYDPINAPWEPPVMPAVPATSSVMEAFMDTPLINGTPYPSVTLQPKSYRFRILNGANDRSWNLQLYTADTSTVSADGRRLTEVKMVPAAPTPGFPALWPVDGRPGGVPDPATVGPDFVQIGTEGGFLPAPTIVKNQPVDWNLNPKTFTYGNVSSKALALGPAERADVIVDFSKYAGQTLILYNDAPAAWPAKDGRNDYFTNAPDQSATGGTKGALVGWGPNTRTLMQIKIAAVQPAPAFNFETLQAAWTTTADHVGVFKESQDPIIVGQTPYDSAYATSFPSVFPYWGYSRIQDTSMSFKTVTGTAMSLDMEPKAIHDEMGAAYDQYGRMMGKLGLEVPTGNAVTQMFIGQGYIDPATEVISESMSALGPVAGDGTQIWKITHNGVDTHPIHFHLFDVQLLNRVGWDGAIELPDPNELGWKETVRVNPLEDTIVALRPVAPKLPFGVPDSWRPLDPTQPVGGTMGFTNRDTTNGNPLATPTVNEVVNFGWEYMWHCHILSHEEMEMMRPIIFEVGRSLPATPTLAAAGVPGAPIGLTWIDATPPDSPLTWGDPSNEIGFRIDRTTVDAAGAELAPYSGIATTTANATVFTDSTTLAGTAYAYKVFAFNAAGEVGSAPARVAPSGFFAENVISPLAVGNGSITPSIATTVASGADSPAFALAADPASHLLVTEIDAASIGTSSTVTFTNVLADHALWGFFVPDSLTVTPIVGSGGGIGIGVSGVPGGSILPATAQQVDYGTNLTFTMTPQTGHHVDSVLVDGASVGPVSSYTFTNVTRPHTIEVVFAINTYQIAPTFSGPGTITQDTLQTIAWGGSATFTMAPAADATLIDVLVDGASVGPVTSYTFTDVTGNHTIFATFESNAFTITSSAGPNGSISPLGAHTVTSGGSQAFTITPATGYHVADVLVNGSSVGAVPSYLFTNVTADATISATFAINTYTIMSSAGPNGSISPLGAQTLTYGGSQAFTITPATGYHVADVLVNGSSVGAVTSYLFTNVTADATISATFAINTYTITSSVGPNGSISPLGTQTLTYGGNQAFTITPPTGYHVVDVIVDSVSVGAVSSYTFTSVTGPHTISVTFAINTYVIAPTFSGPGTITPGTPQTVLYSGSATFTVTPTAGSTTLDVVVDGLSVGPVTSYTFTNVTQAHTIFVRFGQPVYRFYNLRKGVHFYTASEAEKDNVIATLSSTYRFEGVAYYLNPANPANNTPLYRFYNRRLGVHFYTASEAEKNNVIATMASTFTFEGVAYYVSLDPSGGATPVYRFYNFRKGVHFYTASEAEKNNVIATLSSTYRLEGVAFYLAP